MAGSRHWRAKPTSWVASFCAALIFGTFPVVADDERATIFVAASLIDVMGELGTEFAAETGREVVFVAGASSTMAKQILSGAPADAFISANKIYADLVGAELDRRVYDLFGNRLVVIAPVDFEGDIALEELPDLLGDGRLALGDPAHVPAGIYAREALENADVWEALAGHLAPTGDVRAVVDFVATGAAPFGITYATDVVEGEVVIAARIDEGLHEPIRYWGLETNPDNVTAELFLTYVNSFDGQVLLDYFGFRSVTSLEPVQ